MKLSFCRVALLALLGISLVYLQQLLVADMVRLTSHWVFTLVEPQPVAGALRVAARAPLYDDYLTAKPHVPLTYGPLLYWVPGMAARVAGVHGALGMLALGRAMTFLCMFGIFGLVMLAARRRGCAGAFAFAAPLPLLWFPYIMEWSARFSPDAQAVLLSLAGWMAARKCGLEGSLGLLTWNAECGMNDCGLRIADCRLTGKALGWMVVAGGLWGAGFFYKPTVVPGQIALLAEVVWGFMNARWKWAGNGPGENALTGTEMDRMDGSLGWRCFGMLLIPYGVFLGIALGGMAALNHFTGGLWWRHEVEAMAVCHGSARFIWEALQNLWRPGLGALALMALLAALNLRRDPLFLAFFISLALDLILLAKQGSNVNYLLGSLALWSVAAAGVFQEAWAVRGELRTGTSAVPGTRAWAGGAWAGVVAVLLLAGVSRAGTVVREMTFPSLEEIQQIDLALKPVAKDKMLSLDPFYGLSHGVPMLYADAYHIALLADAGKIDLKPEIEKVKAGAYAAIVDNRLHHKNITWHDAHLVPVELSRAIENRYKPVVLGNFLVLWAPK